MKKSLLIIGAGGHGRVCAEIAVSCGYTVAFLDDRESDGVIGTTDDIDRFVPQFDECFAAVGSGDLRRAFTERLEKAGARIATLIHPAAYVSPSAKLGAGSVIEPGAIVNAESAIGKGCIVSVGAIVDHDAVIGDYAHINAGAICKSGSKVESGVRIDAGDIVQGF